MWTPPEITLPTPAPGSAQNLLSYYRAYAWKCQTAAQKAPTEKQRDELKKMVSIWREFATQHEQMIRVGEGLVDTLAGQALWLDMKFFGG